MKQVSGKEFAKILERNGWKLARVQGSHHIYVSSEINDIISLPIHGNKPLKPGMLNRSMKIAGIKESDL
jgi:predicted RNA binding protein YcfA (HicA-like mRNA interferase family)